MVSSTLFLASLVALTLGDPLARRAMVVHETQVLPEGFSTRGAAAPETMLNLRIALAQSDPDGLIASLMDVSTPGNALYGQHLTKEEVRVYFTIDELVLKLGVLLGGSLRCAEARHCPGCAGLVEGEWHHCSDELARR